MDHLGQILDDRYRLLQLLGEGGMGSVYLAQHTVIGRNVAVKFLRAELAHDEDMIKRFYREAQAAAAIKHKSIIDVFDVGVAPWGEPYLVMEYLEGESLSAMIRRTGPMDLGAVCAIMEPALLALGAAHDQGIIHRDIKPDNIFIAHVPDEPPLIKLIDFGISKFTKDGEQTKLTKTGELLGTPTYMAPEQARGDSNIGAAADLYSMGIVLYELLTGHLPFKGENYNALIVNILTTEAIPPRESYAAFPIEAESIVLRAIQKDPKHRYQSAQEMLDALKTLQRFNERQERLSEITDGITDMTFAAGDLGSTIMSNKGIDVASDVFAKVVQSSTPSGWTQPTVKKSGVSKGLLIGLAAAVIAIAVGAVVFFAQGPGDEGAIAPAASPVQVPAQPLPEAKQPPLSQDVLITVEGAPQGAEISFNGQKVGQNPFRTKRSKISATLQVVAPGFEAFQISLVPSDDLTIEARLESIAKTDDPGQTGKKGGARRGPRTPGAKKAGEDSSAQTLKQGKRGTEFTEDFE